MNQARDTLGIGPVADSVRLRILFLLTQDLESPSALGRYLPLAQGLARLGHEVHIATLHADYGSLEETHFEQDGVQVRYVAQMHVLKRGNVKSYYPASKLLAVIARATWSLTRAAFSCPVDIVHIGKPHPMNSIAGLLAGWVRGKKVVLDCDDYEAQSNRFGGSWQQRIVALFEDAIPSRVRHVTTHSRFLRDRLLSLGIPVERITRVPNGIDRERFAHTDPAQVEALRAELGLAGHKVVAFIGSLSSPSHPLDLLLDAFLHIHRVEAASKLLIVGGGEDYGRLRERVTQMGLGDAALFVGRVPSREVPAYYRLADVLVDPVYDDPVGQSRMPLKLFESWASGVPFVSGDVGDRADILGTPPAGVLVRPGDPGALAEGILGILRQPQDAAAYRRRGLERIERYHWSRLAREMEAVYLGVMTASQRRGR
jgi:glycosyltransferase involved in cell wall biosynthesis